MIIAVIVVVIAGGLYLWLKPRDTIEYHKRMLVSSSDQSWSSRVWSRITGEGSATDRRRLKHEAALIRLGYLERREFPMMKIAGQDPVPVIGRAASSNIGGIFSVTKDRQQTKIIVTGVREDMPKWERLIGELRAGGTNR